MAEPYRPRYVVMRIAAPTTIEHESDGMTYVLSEAMWVPEEAMGSPSLWEHVRPWLAAAITRALDGPDPPP